MMTILLYGHLGRAFGKVHRYDVHSAAEAVRALCVTLDGFRKAVIDGGSYRVLTGGKDHLGEENLTEPLSTRKTLRIIPVIEGAGGIFKTIIGAALIVIGTFVVQQPWLVNIGISMVLGGVAEMLFAPKKANDTTQEKVENLPSYTFDGATNTAAQGNPISVLYGGPLIVGSQVTPAALFGEQF